MATQGNATATATSGGTSGAMLLFIVLLILKVNPGGYLDSPVEDWSWWIITAPLWGGLAVLLAILLISGIVLFVADRLDKRAEKKRRKAMAERRAARYSR